MAEETQLFTQDPDTGEYVEYQPPSWKDQLPEELRDNEHLKGFEKPEDLAKTLLELKTSQPQLPQSPDEYEAELPEGFEVNEEDLKTFKSLAHEAGLTNEAFQKVLAFEAEREMKALEAFEAQVEENRKAAEEALKKEWGDKYDENREKAQKFAKVISEKLPDGGKEFSEFMEDTRFGDNPIVLKFLAAAADAISEDAIVQNFGKKTDNEPPRTIDGKPLFKYPSMGQTR